MTTKLVCASFEAVAAQARNKVGPLTHAQEVTRLYKESLKVLFAWTVDRRIFLDQADLLRARFDEPKTMAAGIAALKAGKVELFDHTHPDMYCIPYMPGGSKFMRNPPPPLELVYNGKENIPEGAYSGTNTPVWPDMIPISFRPKMTGVLVDFTKKNME